MATKRQTYETAESHLLEDGSCIANYHYLDVKPAKSKLEKFVANKLRMIGVDRIDLWGDTYLTTRRHLSVAEKFGPDGKFVCLVDTYGPGFEKCSRSQWEKFFGI